MLHTVNKSPYRSDSLKLCLDYVSKDDTVLLIEDGVYGAMVGGGSQNLVDGAAIQIYALGPDLKARGISEDKLIDAIKVVGFDGFVQLAAESDKVQSWL